MMDYTGGASPVAPWDTPDPAQQTGGNFLPTWQQVIASPSSAGATPSVTSPLLSTPSPKIATPPVMTAMPEDAYWPYEPPPYDARTVDPGGLIAGSGMGCLGGMGGLAGILAITGPGEVAAPVGCAVGAVGGALGAIMAPAFDNSLHGITPEFLMPPVTDEVYPAGS
jgi:hypothetical protein